MVLLKAGPAEILRSTQKDEFVIKKLQKLLEEVYLRVAGPRHLIQNKTMIQDVGQVLYFACTTLSGLQTLGEEYTGILQVDDSFTSIPSFLNRMTMVVFHCFGHRLTNAFLLALERNVQRNREMRPEAKAQILTCISLLKAFLPSIELLHKALFYCFWNTYHLSKRFTNVHYVLIRYWLRDKKSLFGFRILGGITMANFVLFSFQTLHDLWRRDTSEQTTSANDEGPDYTSLISNVSSKKCVMCLSALEKPTATMCGHVFCWLCINNWVQNQDKCPSCRETVQRNRLIPLMNYL